METINIPTILKCLCHATEDIKVVFQIHAIDGNRVGVGLDIRRHMVYCVCGIYKVCIKILRNLYYNPTLSFSYHGVHQTCKDNQGPFLQAACPEAVHHYKTPEEVLMRKSFLFRVPGYHGMYDFEEIRDMGLAKTKSIGVTEIMKPNHSRDVGKMTVAAILTKFG